ncbi:type IV secretion system protein VirB1 [Brevundimonas alba]|uniref:Type IV secretion system protein VirB1 n=1 Tax=Brevundimonas alba TaxID=74314 RepID=A0A7X5YLV3_9CAUL|nr:lytic transglycosylase domain-containing protein [Brevundimonas alba]NJC42059.1 type IV secretion system protein VirB1 [Brevundimonas alba]
MLDLNLILSLSQACAPQVAPETLAAIAYAESRFNPIAIGVNRGPRPTRRPRDAAEAARVARGLLARGANLDLGVAQINSDNLGWLGLSVEAAFDPCRNLAAAGVVLRAGYRPAEGVDRQTTLRVALSRYNTGHPERGFRNGYVARVEAAAATLGVLPLKPIQPGADGPPASIAEPQTPPPAWDVFARARLSVVLTFTSDPDREF